MITQLITSEFARTGTLSLANFYERRARRLLPALSVVVFVTLLLGFALLPFPHAREQLGESAVATLLFVANYYIRLHVGGYFQPAIEQVPLMHTWSLAIEEQFYLVYPIALFALFKISAAASRTRWLSIAIGLITICSFYGNVILVHRDPTRAFYWAPARAWELGVGALLALWAVDHRTARAKTGALVACAGLAMIVAAFTLLRATSPWPGALALIPVLGTAMVIGAVPFSPRSVVARGLVLKQLVWVGRVSYTWYLWHWPLLAIARRWRLGEQNLAADIGWAALALVLAVLTSRFVEGPFRWPRDNFSSPLAKRQRFLITAAATTVFLIGLSGLLIGADRISFKGMATLDLPPAPYACQVGTWSGTLTFGSCASLPPELPSTVAIWGDSHADAWAPMVRELGQAAGVTVMQFGRNSCPPLLGLTPRMNQYRNKSCPTANDAVAKWLRSAAPSGLRGVVLAGRWPRYVGGPLQRKPNPTNSDLRDTLAWASVAVVRAGLEQTLAFTDSIGVRVLILLTPPEFVYVLPECLSVRDSQHCGIARRVVDIYRESSAALIRQVASRHPNVRVIDPIGFFCDANYCAPSIQGELVTRDADHITVAAARFFAPLMREDFRWLVDTTARSSLRSQRP